MRFKIEWDQRWQVTHPPDNATRFQGGDVMTLDEHEAIVAELEAEIDIATCLICHRCELQDQFSPAVRKGRTDEWLHVMLDVDGSNNRPLPCFAASVREAGYQRQLKGSK